MAKIYKGNLDIRNEEDVKKLEGYDGISGYLSINSQAKLDALKSVGGYLSIYSQAKLDAPTLKSVGGYLSIYSQAKLDALKSVGGDLSIYSQAKLDALKSVGGNLYINSEISQKLEKQLWENNSKKKWYVTDVSSEWLLSQKGDINYKINNVEFYKDLFDKVRKDQLTASEVFQLSNTEQRRVAYERMDKIKMKDLVSKVLDKRKDNYENPERLCEFDIEGLKTTIKFFNCICTSTGREYFIETDENTCKLAKAKSFGQEQLDFEEEW